MKRFRIVSFIPAIILLCIIFSFSAQTGEESGSLSYEISYRIMEMKNQIFREERSEMEIEKEAESIHHYVRKAAHMTEYFLLAISFAFPLYLYDIRGGRLFICSILLCLIVAGLDEYHQSFVDGRGPSLKDVGIDCIGAFLGNCVMYVVGNFWIRRKKSICIPQSERGSQMNSFLTL